MTRTPPLLAAALVIALAGCHAKPAGNSLDAMDGDLVNGSVTAEGNDSLRDTITVDPARTGGGAAKTGERKPQSSVTAVASSQADCLKRYGATLAYSKDWVAKLPADLPLHPGARVIEAAGHDGGCAIRVVSFTVPVDRTALVDWYAEKARGAGYGADRETRGTDLYLAGSKGAATYALIAGATRAGATPVDLVWVMPG